MLYVDSHYSLSKLIEFKQEECNKATLKWKKSKKK